MIEIRLGTDADRPQIITRLAEVFGPEPAARVDHLWNWQWHQDPRLPTPGYSGVVAEWRGEIIGTMATIPAGLHIGGKPVTSYWCVDCLVVSGLARQALREHFQQPITSRFDLSVGIGPALLNHPAAGQIQLVKHISNSGMRLLERTGFTAIPDSGSMHRRVSLRHGLGRILGRSLGGLIGAVADLGLPLGTLPHLPIEDLPGSFDERFDKLWDEVKLLYPAICLRDARTLDWRYRLHPDADYRVITTGDGERLRGYLIMRSHDKGRRRWAKIVDLLTAPGDLDAAQALLGAALRTLRARRVERVEAFACGFGVTDLFVSTGFTPRLTKSGGTQPMMVRALPPVTNNFYVTQGDGDGG